METSEIRYGLRFKYVILTSVLLVSISVVLTIVSIVRTHGFLEEALTKRGVSLANNLAHNSTYGISIGDSSSLVSYIKGLMTETDVSYVEILDSRGIVWAHSDASAVGKPDEVPVARRAVESSKGFVEHITWNGEELVAVVEPVLFDAGSPGSSASGEKARIGTVVMGLSTREMDAHLRSIVLWSILLTIVIVAAGIAVASYFVKMSMAPMEKMVTVVTTIANGDFSQAVEVKSRDELGVLGSAFNRMATNLKGMIRKVQDAASEVTTASDQIAQNSQKIGRASCRERV